MPRILVMADEGEGRDTVVLLHERVAPGELESDRSAALLIERLGWALVDADEIEQGTPPPRIFPTRMRLMHRDVGKTPSETRPLRAA